MPLTRYIILLLFVGISFVANTQKVGVVLSGGGASGLTHIGFLRSLEQQNIPIDYITGTSMGAIIGGLYSSGYSLNEIDSLFRTDEFVRLIQGAVNEDEQYFYREPDPDASIARIKISKNGLEKSIPTNLVSPALLDFKLFELMTQASAAAAYNFDSLFIPFRCVASDIESKKEVVFREGHLNLATRASATYPFYLEPLSVDGKLLFDGGLYNNFPGNVMYEDFMPDVILGCNVSAAYDPPKVDDLISQIRTMIIARGDYDSLCTEMVVVTPDVEIGAFDFDQRSNAIFAGFVSTEEKMPEIQALVERRESAEQKEERRAAFKAKFPPLEFDNLDSDGLGRNADKYLRNFLPKNKAYYSLADIRKSFFQLYADENIRSLYPLASYNELSGKFDLHLDILRERDITLRFGGNFSSRSINTGYIGGTYHLLGRNSTQINADANFGNFYSGFRLGVRQYYNTQVPFSMEIRGGSQRWDYFTSFSTFFEEVRPSFIVQYENQIGLGSSIALANKSRLRFDADYFDIEDQYYQNENFTQLDTADNTQLHGATLALEFQRSTLNRKVYSNSGTDLNIGVRYVNAREETIPGSTQPLRDTTMARREWIKIHASYKNYFKKWKAVQLGFSLEGVYSSQPLLSNFRATLLRAPSFDPIPESSTFFINQYRNTTYTSAGFITVVQLFKNLELRPELYLFTAPLGEIGSNELLQAERSLEVDPLVIGSFSLIYQSPLGPVSLSANYYDQKEEPLSILFNFGYLLNHKRVLD